MTEPSDSSANIRPAWRHYLVQSLLAVIATGVVLLLLNWQNWFIVTALGSTVFVLFVMPHRSVAQPRNTVVGHFIGIVCGMLCSFLPQTSLPVTTFVYALSVGLAIFVMLMTDTEQPPAAGTALAFAINGFSVKTGLTTLISVVILSLIHQLLKGHLRNLVGSGHKVGQDEHL
ncbi:MAG: HPP family protein [Anaerolineae bacterium]